MMALRLCQTGQFQRPIAKAAMKFRLCVSYDPDRAMMLEMYLLEKPGLAASLYIYVASIRVSNIHPPTMMHRQSDLSFNTGNML